MILGVDEFITDLFDTNISSDFVINAPNYNSYERSINP